MYKLGTIREWKTENFHVVVDALEEQDLDLSWDDTGETLKGLQNGSLVAFCARARVLFRGLEVASDYLGNCIYKSLEDFADHRQCAAYTRKLNRLHGKFNIYKESASGALLPGDKLKRRGFATRERAEQWAKANAKEPYRILGPSVCGSYFADMVKSVCSEARKEVQKLQGVRVRAEVKA